MRSAILSLTLSILSLSAKALDVSLSGRADASDLGLRDLAKVATAWYAGWHADDFPLSKVSWSRYTQLTYAFATTTPDVSVLSLEDSDEALLPRFVSEAHKHGVKASLSIGGWTGSLYYSTNVGSAENRTTFVKTVVDLANKYKLDGIDFDWEYPGNQGIGCNAINPNDVSNFLSFLQELRRDPTGAKLILSAATSITPWHDATGNPTTDVSGFSDVLTYIAIMNYDIWGSWSATVGPNAPLDDSCASAQNRQGSAVSAVKAWKAAGMPSHQIVLGVPSYGHSFRVKSSSAFDGNSLALYPAFDANAQPVGDKWDDGAGPDTCGVQQGPGGVFDFWGMVDAGFLNPDGNPGSGISYVFDTCSQTPFVYNATSEVMISYDNAKSFAAKGNFIKSNDLLGFAIWEAGGDFNDILLNSILNGNSNGATELSLDVAESNLWCGVARSCIFALAWVLGVSFELFG